MIEESAVEDYVAKWAEGMKGRLTDLQVDVDDEKSEVNGLQQVYSVGSATLEGKPIQWDLTIVKGGKKVLAVMALGEDLDGVAVQEMYASIRRIAPDGRPTVKGQDRGTNAPLADDGLDTPEGAAEPQAEEPANEEPPPP